MNYERQKILIDIDDTLLKSSIEIIRELNTKNNTYKFLNDLKDYGYRSIDKNITQKEIKENYRVIFADAFASRKDGSRRGPYVAFYGRADSSSGTAWP